MEEKVGGYKRLEISDPNRPGFDNLVSQIAWGEENNEPKFHDSDFRMGVQ